MPKELLPDSPPIEAGPIIIDNFYHAHLEYEATHISYSTFVIEALSHNIDQNRATWAMRFSVQALIEHLDLGILPPYESIDKVDQEWGPYGVQDYFIDRLAFVRHAELIMARSVSLPPKPGVLFVLELVKGGAEEWLAYETKFIPVEQLPGALYTPIYPKEHLDAGNLVSYQDFANAAYLLRTSPMKVAQVFDEVVRLLGDDKAKKELAKLEYLGNPTTRRQIRYSLYIKTQSLADLVSDLSVMPVKLRGRFNAKSMQVLRHVFSDEMPPDLDIEENSDNAHELIIVE